MKLFAIGLNDPDNMDCPVGLYTNLHPTVDSALLAIQTEIEEDFGDGEGLLLNTYMSDEGVVVAYNEAIGWWFIYQLEYTG